MIQSINQSYDFKKDTRKEINLAISKLSASKLPFAAEGFEATNTKDAIVEAKGSGGGVVPNPSQPAQYYLDSVKIGGDAYIVKQVPRDGSENNVLVKKPMTETGTQWTPSKNIIVDLSSIADEYNPNATSPYSVGDKVTYENKFYKCSSMVVLTAGPFNSSMWDQVLPYDSTQTYNTGDKVLYVNGVYQCLDDSVTGEWDNAKWTEITGAVVNYSESATNYESYGYTTVIYEDHVYTTNSSYRNTGGPGSFNPAKWTATSVENEMNNLIKSFAVIPAGSSITTDANGYLRFTISTSGLGAINILALSGGNSQPNTGAYFELVASSYVGSSGTLVIKVTDDTGAPMKETTLTAYMTSLLRVLYMGVPNITGVTQVQ